MEDFKISKNEKNKNYGKSEQNEASLNEQKNSEIITQKIDKKYYQNQKNNLSKKLLKNNQKNTLKNSIKNSMKNNFISTQISDKKDCESSCENTIKKLKDLKGKKVHFIGIGGISMSALAQILKTNKIEVQGSDISENEEVKILQKKGIKVFLDHSINNVLGSDVVVYSSAIKDGNEELEFARKMGLIVFKRAELLGIVASGYKNVIAIAGSHGKTTATAMISEIFIKAGLKPTVHIGGRDCKIQSNYLIGNKKIFITEACEYMDNYLYLSPNVSVILNIDGDHLDYFKTTENVTKSFENFANNTQKNGVIFVNGDDANAEKISSYANSTTFGISSKKCELKAKNIKEYALGKFSFNPYFCGYSLGKVKLNILGRHNIYNALVCILIALAFDIEFKDIKAGIESFSGVERRTEYVGQLNGASVFHDYAHHPKQIEMMIDVAKNLVFKSNKQKHLLNDYSLEYDITNNVNHVLSNDFINVSHFECDSRESVISYKGRVCKEEKRGQEMIFNDSPNFESGKIIVVFEPHTYSRTKYLLDDFAKSFVRADFVFLAPVYSAREDESQGKSSLDLANLTKKYIKNVELINDYNDIILRLKQVARKNDIVLILGAGTINKLAEMIKNLKND